VKNIEIQCFYFIFDTLSPDQKRVHPSDAIPHPTLSRRLLLIHKSISRAYTILQSPLAPLFKGGNLIKVPLEKGDSGGSIAT
jgi:hypothetical protein